MYVGRALMYGWLTSAVLAVGMVAMYFYADGLRLQLAAAERNFGICDATLTAFLEGEEIDDAIPDDLRDYDPSDWLLPSGD